MKTRKIASLVAGFAVVASFSAVSAYAAEGYLLEMNSGSTAATRLVDVYYVGSLEDVGSFSLELNGLLEASVSTVKFNSDITADKIEYAELGDDYAIIVGGDTANAVVDGKLKLGTLEIVFPEGTGDVAVTVDIDESWVSNAEMGDFSGESFGGYAMDPVSFTIVAELGGGKEEFKPVDAKYVGTFDDDKSTVPVAAWTAEVNYDAVEVKGTLKWAISNGTQEVKKDTTVVTDAGVVLYGLAIAGRADQLSTIESVQLIAE